MTRRITLLLGVTCVVLFVLAATGCGPDEAAAPPRAVPGTSAPPGASPPPTDDDPEADRELCDAAVEAADDLSDALAAGSLVDVASDFFERIVPYADGQLREDIELMLSTIRGSLGGAPVTPEQDVEIAEASARVMREMERRCADLVLPGAA